LSGFEQPKTMGCQVVKCLAILTQNWTLIDRRTLYFLAEMTPWCSVCRCHC